MLGNGVARCITKLVVPPCSQDASPPFGLQS